MKMSYASLVATMLPMTILMVQVNVGMAIECNPVKLVPPCYSFVTGNTTPPPDSECCNVLHDQNKCLCLYVRNPLYQPFLSMPGIKTVAQACSIKIPDPKTCILWFSRW
ncbi:putative bifunctional inhibitor/plant lipid transfer protein/seed storage helical [Helianthus debilis subsp. tardiflorus]